MDDESGMEPAKPTSPESPLGPQNPAISPPIAPPSLFDLLAAQISKKSRTRSTLAMAPKYYHDDPDWADVTPLPQDDGGLHPLAAINYTEEYSEAMSYLRALMAANEFSARALTLTEHIISMNPAHYTVWLYRAKVLSETGANLREEIEWLNPTALQHLKNYQIWHHRQTIIDKLGSADGEADFISSMLEQDSKNYHVWSYRQWLVKRFGIFDKGELSWTEGMIADDVRNNSAWNHRYYIVVGARAGEGVTEDIVQREIEYVQAESWG
jgi:protein farnesyltransferase/geranylgeranyltransferase type-1 subunit alpha